VLISPLFFEKLFCAKVFCTAFLHSPLSYVFFWQKYVGAKAVRKMLVKLITD